MHEGKEYHFKWESHKGDKPHSIVHTINVTIDNQEEITEIYEVTHDFMEYEKIFIKVGFTQLDKITLPERTIYVLHKEEMKP